MKLIELRKVTFAYKGAEKPAIIDIDLEIDAGETLCIMGPSGSGKSTLCYCLAGLVPKLIEGELKGEILLKGEDILEVKSRSGFIEVGLILQDPESQIVALTVERELAFGLENLGVPKEVIKKKVLEISKALGIEGIIHRSTCELSGGELQRVAIASIVVLEPKILILDEPTSSLDYSGVQALRSTLKNLKERGFTIIIAEHDIEDLLDIIDRIVILKDGRKIAEGPPLTTLSLKEVKEAGIEIPIIIDFYDAIKKGDLTSEIPIDFQKLVKMMGEDE